MFTVTLNKLIYLYIFFNSFKNGRQEVDKTIIYLIFNSNYEIPFKKNNVDLFRMHSI